MKIVNKAIQSEKPFLVSGACMGMLLLILSSTAWSAPGDNLRFYGSLVAEPCVISPEESEIQLDFGTIVDKQLYQYGQTRKYPFYIHLADCDLTLGNTLKISFYGTESPLLPGFLAPDAGSSATNIAIGLETNDEKKIPVNVQSNAFSLMSGDNIIALKAYVKGDPFAVLTRNIERGEFNAVAVFNLEYE